MGLGIGLLASVALSLAPSLTDLAITGAEVLRIAFRLGVEVSEVSQNLEPGGLTGCSDPWAYVVPDVDTTEIQKNLELIQVQNVRLLDLSCDFLPEIS